ncbi:hypothetical protein BD310DRAFT_913452 [Dichomitus squalens]|uniref:Uncharacterized protein n=1 Tax=Dichomitus squalens TaxID=114155 RepID=A0A4Q9QAY4_9APHY|nr:hypothetical protein BD310DRAFT_913452 [Dichomitus squalens]
MRSPGIQTPLPSTHLAHNVHSNRHRLYHLNVRLPPCCVPIPRLLSTHALRASSLSRLGDLRSPSTCGSYLVHTCLTPGPAVPHNHVAHARAALALISALPCGLMCIPVVVLRRQCGLRTCGSCTFGHDTKTRMLTRPQARNPRLLFAISTG